jgi:glucoside 3-dehydrogenase (cytochrome c) hitch-hiker subunit
MSESETRDAQLIDRREAIRRVTALLGGVALVGGSGVLEASERVLPRAAVTRQGVGPFTAQDIALLDEVAETILPETKTPGAKAAQTGAFMALMVTDTYTERDQAVFRDGMEKLRAASFMALTPAQRLALLEQLDREQKAYMDVGGNPGWIWGSTATMIRQPFTRRGNDTPPHFFRMMKELALLGYFTSEIGCTQAQRYVEVPGRFDPCVPYTPGDPAWAAHA